MSHTSTEQRGKQDLQTPDQASTDRERSYQSVESSYPQGGVTPTQSFFVQIGGQGQPQQMLVQSVVDAVLPVVAHELISQIQRDPQLASAFIPVVAEQLILQMKRDPQLGRDILQSAGIKINS